MTSTSASVPQASAPSRDPGSAAVTRSTDLSGKVAIVTGAGRGIGAEIARVFAAAGAKICVAELDMERGMQTAQALREGGGEAVALKVDVTSEREVDQLVQRTIETLGGVDILVSNAGIQSLGEIVDVSFESWRRMIATHLDGAFLTTRACLRHMYASGRGGAIVYIGSVHSKEASVLKGPYVAAKHGVLGLCRAVAKEGAKRGVRANAICPGFVFTEMMTRQFPTLAAQMCIAEDEVLPRLLATGTIDGQPTYPSDIAQMALYLVAFPTMALTGQSVVVSHGWHME